MKKTFHIWEGVYKDFKEVPARGDGHKGKKWIDKSLEKITALRDAAKEKKTVPSIIKYDESLLPVIAAIVYNDQGHLNILDFGGSIGFTYYQVARSLPENSCYQFHIVETDLVCDAGRIFFKNETSIFFHNGIPENIDNFHIVHMGSSLHYIEDWQHIIRRLCKRTSGYFLFTDLAAGDIPTYATAQKYYDSLIPMWFFNINDIISAMEFEGFQLVFKSTYMSTILGVEQPYPQNNFDKEYRLGRSCSLLFKKR